MNTKIILIFLVILAMFGFKENNSNQSTLFKKYTSTLHTFSVPLSYSCEYSLPIQEVDTSLSNSFKSPGLAVSGKIFPNEPFVTILQGFVTYTYYPSIYTYTTVGKPIDSIIIAENCGSDIGVTTQTVTEIFRNKSIIITDSTRESLVRNQVEIIKGHDSLFVRQRKYKLNESGHFIVIADKQYRKSIK
jgi:hypothetical protein